MVLKGDGRMIGHGSNFTSSIIAAVIEAGEGDVGGEIISNTLGFQPNSMCNIGFSLVGPALLDLHGSALARTQAGLFVFFPGVIGVDDESCCFPIPVPFAFLILCGLWAFMPSELSCRDPLVSFSRYGG